MIVRLMIDKKKIIKGIRKGMNKDYLSVYIEVPDQGIEGQDITEVASIACVPKAKTAKEYIDVTHRASHIASIRANKKGKLTLIKQ